MLSNNFLDPGKSIFREEQNVAEILHSLEIMKYQIISLI